MVSVNPANATGVSETVSVKVPRLEMAIWPVPVLVPVAAFGTYKGWDGVSLKSPTLSVKLVTEPR
jgi:hypothetical protein